MWLLLQRPMFYDREALLKIFFKLLSDNKACTELKEKKSNLTVTEKCEFILSQILNALLLSFSAKILNIDLNQIKDLIRS